MLRGNARYRRRERQTSARGSRAAPMNFGSVNPTVLWRVGAGLACFFLASAFRRTLPPWAHLALLALGAALLLGGFLL